MTHRVGAKGQVVIPKELRDELGIEPGDEVSFWRDGDHVAVRPASHRPALRGRFEGSALVDDLTAQRHDDRSRGSTVTVVLDSWAVLRYLENAEPSARLVAELLDDQRPLMSWINLGEVHYIVRRAHGEDAAATTVRDLRDVIDARLPDERVVLDAARIKADHHMAYADAFGAALAVSEYATLWTGDPELLVVGASWQWRDIRNAA